MFWISTEGAFPASAEEELVPPAPKWSDDSTVFRELLKKFREGGICILCLAECHEFCRWRNENLES